MQKRSILFSLLIFLMIVLTGCFKGEQSLKDLNAPVDNQKQAEPQEEPKDDQEKPKEVSKKDTDEKANTDEKIDKATDKEENKEEAEESDETVARQLYLIDANGMVAPQTLELPKTTSKEVATQALEYLVKGGPVTSVLPNGFQAVLPEGTEILGLNLKEGTMTVDVSEEFKNYDAKEEVQILEAITHTLTQFENVDKVQLWINGHELKEMPVNGTPIGQGYSRSNGINVMNTAATGKVEAQVVTMYFPKEHNDNRYYVPITKHIENTDGNLYGSIVRELIEGPGYETNASHVFNSNTILKSDPKLEEGVLELEFAESILKDSKSKIIADEVIETLVRTLTEQESVDAVKVRVENVETLVNENGEVYNDPVSKYKYMPKEKL